MNEEKYIEERVGKRNPFQVPEGYFDSFADRMMQQLPERPVSVEASPKVRKPALTVRMRPWLYAAACALVLVVSVWMWQSAPDTNVATGCMPLPVLWCLWSVCGCGSRRPIRMSPRSLQRSLLPSRSRLSMRPSMRLPTI